MGHYDDAYEADYAEQRRKRRDELKPLYERSEQLLGDLRRAGVGHRVTDRLQEMLFWLSEQMPPEQSGDA